MTKYVAIVCDLDQNQQRGHGKKGMLQICNDHAITGTNYVEIGKAVL